MSADYGDDLDFALQLAEVADAVSMSRFRAIDLRVSTKPDRSPVTEADMAVEEAVWAEVARRRPADSRYGEESSSVGDVHGRCWVLDPIDGTANYLRGVPIWATLIGLVVGGVPMVGVVSAPALGRRWWARPGGSWTSDIDGGSRRLHVSAVADMADASVSYSDFVGWDEVAQGSLSRLTDGVWRTRGIGDFWSHLLVAEGAVDIGAEPSLRPWDVAALIPIVEQAGGSITGVDGKPVLQIIDDDLVVSRGALSTNGHLTDSAVRRILGPAAI
jgi:histidinol-phosphatase